MVRSGVTACSRSQENIDIAEWAEGWIKSGMAVQHMVRVMQGKVRSRRHVLFLDRWVEGRTGVGR